MVLVWIFGAFVLAGATMLIIVRRRSSAGSGPLTATDVRSAHGAAEMAASYANRQQQSGPGF